MEKDKLGIGNRVALILLSVIIGIIVITVVQGSISIMTGSPFDLFERYHAYIFKVITISFTFLVLSVLNIRKLLPWLLGLALTMFSWGYYVFDVVSSRGSGTGVNIGLAIFLLFSPVFFSIACVFLAKKL